jgi:hypothetical protein
VSDWHIVPIFGKKWYLTGSSLFDGRQGSTSFAAHSESTGIHNARKLMTSAPIRGQPFGGRRPAPHKLQALRAAPIVASAAAAAAGGSMVSERIIKTTC